IKNEEAKVLLESGVEVASTDAVYSDSASSMIENTVADENKLYGFWVGYFEKDMKEDVDNEKAIYADEYEWQRENKINISIDKIVGEIVTGHSVVAGNNRPFSGTVKNEAGVYHFDVKEPGDNKYDGAFTFRITDTLLEGTWKAFKTIDIPKRKYRLTKKVFKYNPDIMLTLDAKRFVDWEKSKSKVLSVEGEEEYRNVYFSAATKLIFTVNASNKLLTVKEVENLKKGDLLVIRNTIYARHGYSFKNRPLRVFFDAQPWYIPVFSDIKSEFTDIEKKNIELLLRYEKNAKEYYDYFGRG
ncbi:MAG: YARHG domain-containing protein, partial [Flavobacterium sp.]